ncbi:flippase [soil metagenome]
MIRKNIGKISTIIKENKYILFHNVFDRLFFFVFFVLIAKNYDVELYGKLITFFTIGAITAITFDMGLSTHLQKEIARKNENKNNLFNTAFKLNAFLFLPYVLAAFIIYTVFINDMIIIYSLVIIINFFISQINICNKALSGYKSFKNQFIASFYPKIIFLILYLILIYKFKPDLLLLMLCLAVFLLFNLISALFFCYRAGFSLILSNGKSENYMTFLKLSFPLGIALIINLLYDKIDILLVSRLAGFTETGFYNAAYSIFKASTLGFTFILNKGFNEFAEIKNDNILFKRYIIKYAKIIFGICIFINLILFFIPDIFILFFYSSKFTDSSIILKILSFAFIGLGLNNLLGTALNGRGEYKAVMYITLVSLILNVILNLIFIPLSGIKAAATITVITEWMIFAGELIYVLRILKINQKLAHI